MEFRTFSYYKAMESGGWQLHVEILHKETDGLVGAEAGPVLSLIDKVSPGFTYRDVIISGFSVLQGYGWCCNEETDYALKNSSEGSTPFSMLE